VSAVALDEPLVGRIEALSPARRQLLQRLLERRDAPPAADAEGTAQAVSMHQLVACVVARPGQSLEPAEVRAYLGERLPAYLIPSRFIGVERLPRTATGKLDRRALVLSMDGVPHARDEFVAPRSEIEEELAQVWQEVLGLEAVSVNDNFFEVGGDSILSIQMVSRARRRGLELTPNMVFESQTIAEQALVVQTDSGITSEQEIVSGPVALTPIQSWFFEQAFAEPGYWNQAVMLEVQADLGVNLLEQALRHVVSHHDLLRARFSTTGAGWEQSLDGDAGVSVGVQDLSGISAGERAGELDMRATQVQAGLDLESGGLLRAELFVGREPDPPCLLIVAHHLVVDIVSWTILLEDLETSCQQLSRGEEATLPAKTTSYRRWAQHLQQRARSLVSSPEREHWLRTAAATTGSIPVDSGGAGTHTEAEACRVSVSITVDETRSLIRDVPRAFNTRLDDVLLTAVVEAFSAWTGRDELKVGVESHGRLADVDGIDLSRTVGWFTSFYPVALSIRDLAEPGARLKAVKEQLREVPSLGVGYGVARYLGDDTALPDALSRADQPQVLFVNLGRVDGLGDGLTLLRLAPELSIGRSRALGNHRTHLIEVNARITGKKLLVEWVYGRTAHQRATVEGLAQRFLDSLRCLIAHCVGSDAGGYTPSDFPEASLGQDALDRLVARIRDNG